MKWGLFGGTFDPIHIGHLRCAEEMMELFDLNRIIFVPASRPPHKINAAITPFYHREQMIRLAIEGNPAFSFSDVENRRAGTSYSVETVEYLLDKYRLENLELYFILGQDAFHAIRTTAERSPEALAAGVGEVLARGELALPHDLVEIREPRAVRLDHGFELLDSRLVIVIPSVLGLAVRLELSESVFGILGVDGYLRARPVLDIVKGGDMVGMAVSQNDGPDFQPGIGNSFKDVFLGAAGGYYHPIPPGL